MKNRKDNLYVYDKSENTIQRYNDEVINDLIKENDDFVKYTIIIGSIIYMLNDK